MRVSHRQMVSLERSSEPLYLQIYKRLRQLILDGAWEHGRRLPSSRTIAQDLGVSRNTALLAIDKLMADGWLEARRGSGVYVASDAPPKRASAPRIPSPSNDAGAATPVPFEIAHGAVDIFPTRMWRAMQNKVWQNDGADALPEGDGAGWLPLRRELALHLHAMRGVACSPEQIIVVSSVQAAIDLTLRVLAEPGDGIWIEDPGYPQARAAFDYHRLRQHPVPVDHDGIRVDVGLARAADARLAYVTPACHFPLCTLLSQARREALLSWADAGDAYVIEDDWDFNAAFNGQFPVEPLAASASDRVIFIHSLNRILFPGLRITALVVPAKLTHRFVAARKAIDGFPNVANQMTLSRFMGEGMLSAHLRRCRAVYEERRSAMQQAVAEHLAPWLVIDDQTRGLHRVLQSRVEPDTELASRGRSAGVPCSALSDFAIEPLAGNGALVLGFGAFSPAAIAQAAQRLGLALERE